MSGSLYKYSDALFNERLIQNESVIEVYNRVQALTWACNLGDEKCINKSKTEFEKWMKNESLT